MKNLLFKDFEGNSQNPRDLKINPICGGWTALIILSFIGISIIISLIRLGFAADEGQAPSTFTVVVMLLCIMLIVILLIGGLEIIPPKYGVTATFFGKYKGEFTQNGFWFFHPFVSMEKTSLRDISSETKIHKVTDQEGNPINMGIAFVWKVKSMYDALYEVDNYKEYLANQADAALRKVAKKHIYPYETEQVIQEICKEINDHVSKAGLEVSDGNVVTMAYAEEIAHAMLQKQQAKAVIAGRKEIVEGAVGIVDDTVEAFEKKGISFTPDEKNRFARELVLVITGDRVTPTISM